MLERRWPERRWANCWGPFVRHRIMMIGNAHTMCRNQNKLPLLAISSIHLLLFTLFYSFSTNFLALLLVFLLCELLQMAPKRIWQTQTSSSSNPPAPNAPTFPTYFFASKMHQEKYLRVRNYNLVKERDFEVDNMEGHEELVVVLEERGLTQFNNFLRDYPIY